MGTLGATGRATTWSRAEGLGGRCARGLAVGVAGGQGRNVDPEGAVSGSGAGGGDAAAELEWQWIPPDNIEHEATEEDLFLEEVSSPLEGVGQQTRRRRIEEWTHKAEIIMDRKEGLIKVIPGQWLSVEEVVTAFEVSKGENVVHIVKVDGTSCILCTAMSSGHMKKLVRVIYKSMILRKLRFRELHRPIIFTPDFSHIENGPNMAIFIMSAAKRAELNIEAMITPGATDVLALELEAQFEAERIYEESLARDGKPKIR